METKLKHKQKTYFVASFDIINNNIKQELKQGKGLNYQFVFVNYIILSQWKLHIQIQNSVTHMYAFKV